MRVADVMTQNPICCVPSDTAQVAALIMRDEDVGIVPVVGSDKNRMLIGVVTDRNLCLSVIADRHQVLIAEGEDPTNVPVEKYMTSNVVTCLPDDDIDRALNLMEENRVRRIVVVDHQKIIHGIVSFTDLVLRSHIPPERLIEALKHIGEPARAGEKPKAESAGERG
jgi:CBS domain-containing protein